MTEEEKEPTRRTGFHRERTITREELVNDIIMWFRYTNRKARIQKIVFECAYASETELWTLWEKYVSLAMEQYQS